MARQGVRGQRRRAGRRRGIDPMTHLAHSSAALNEPAAPAPPPRALELARTPIKFARVDGILQPKWILPPT